MNTRTLTIVGLAVLLLGLLVASNSSAAIAAISEDAKLTASDGAAGDQFGFSSSTSRDIILVGAPRDGDDGDKSGSAYVFELDDDGQIQETKLKAGDAEAGDEFGTRVSISGNILVVGARRDDNVNGTRAGAAYVFKRHGRDWRQEAKLIASDGAAGDRFGQFVSISGDTAVVGAPRHDSASVSNSGAAYVFELDDDGADEVQKLTADVPAEHEQFGRSLDIREDTIGVGAPGDDTNFTGPGSVHIFVRSGGGWSPQDPLSANDGEGGDQFGYRVSIGDDIIAVTALRDDASKGSAYVFD